MSALRSCFEPTCHICATRTPQPAESSSTTSRGRRTVDSRLYRGRSPGDVWKRMQAMGDGTTSKTWRGIQAIRLRTCSGCRQVDGSRGVRHQCRIDRRDRRGLFVDSVQDHVGLLPRCGAMSARRSSHRRSRSTANMRRTDALAEVLRLNIGGVVVGFALKAVFGYLIQRRKDPRGCPSVP